MCTLVLIDLVLFFSQFLQIDAELFMRILDLEEQKGEQEDRCNILI